MTMRSPDTFFLTGCASGIGQHLAGRLLEAGHRVYATDIELEKMEAWAEAHSWPAERVTLRRLDVRSPESWTERMGEATEIFGEIDVVINIAGCMLSEWVHEMTAESLDRHIDINFKGMALGTREAARRMIARGHGLIINIASMSALAPIPGIAVYAASKHACRAFSIAAALELRKHNIQVTTISPDVVATPLLAPQRGVEAAGILFSAPHLLTVEEIARSIIDRAIPHRPLEIIIPRHRGWIARFANIFPQTGFIIGPLFHRLGSRKQIDFFSN